MAELFSDLELSTHPEIPGLTYLREYITEAEETRLVKAIDAEPWDETWDRRRQPYGVTYGPKKGERRPIPPWGMTLVDRFHAEGISDRRFDQMLVNEYEPGQGISLHRDYDPFDRTVVSLSLLSSCVMDFRHAKNRRRETILLEPRSLLILSDEARYGWEHGIARRKRDRWEDRLIPRIRRMSATFRALKP